MQAWRKALLEDPALLAMGLVPGRDLPAAVAANGAALSWRMAWTTAGLGIVLLFAVFWPAVERAVIVWNDSATFNHGFLILPICGYLMWIKRGALASTIPQPSWWGLAFIVPAGVAWLVGNAASVMVVQQFALVGMIYGLVLTIFGIEVVRRMMFPLFYLIFAVPFGEFLIAPLQDVTALFVVIGLRLVDIPVFLDGVFLSIPTGNFEVAEACAGLRFLIATIALGFLFAHITYVTWWRRVAFIALSIVVPVVANGFRAFGIVLIAYLTNNEVAVGVDHIVYGWIFFAFVTVILLAIGMTFRENTPEESAPDLQAMHRVAGHAASPRRIATATALALAAALAAPVYAAATDARPVQSIRATLVAPAIGNGWTPASSAGSDWAPVFPTADGRLQRSFVKDGHEVQLYVAFYMRQRQGAELVQNENRLADDKIWSRAASGIASAKVDGEERTVATTRMLNRGRGRLAYHWYWVGGRYTENPYMAKVFQALDRLGGGSGAAAAIIVGTAYDDRPAEAAARLRDFLSSSGAFRPMLERSAGR